MFLYDLYKLYDDDVLSAMLEQEKQRIEQLTAGWDDSTAVNWDDDDRTDMNQGQESSELQSDQQIFKCTALYSYTVNMFFLISRRIQSRRMIKKK